MLKKLIIFDVLSLYLMAIISIVGVISWMEIKRRFLRSLLSSLNVSGS